jgi:hypothetical protein
MASVIRQISIVCDSKSGGTARCASLAIVCVHAPAACIFALQIAILCSALATDLGCVSNLQIFRQCFAVPRFVRVPRAHEIPLVQPVLLQVGLEKGTLVEVSLHKPSFTSALFALLLLLFEELAVLALTFFSGKIPAAFNFLTLFLGQFDVFALTFDAL